LVNYKGAAIKMQNEASRRSIGRGEAIRVLNEFNEREAAVNKY
jgi:hypothetical protein